MCCRNNGRLRISTLVLLALGATAPSKGTTQTLGQEVLSIGALEAPPEEVFGRIADVVVDSGGHIYVLDELYHDLRVFDDRGRFLAATGRHGKGPGEFDQELSAFVDQTGAVQVADGGNLRISSFRLDGDSVLLVAEARTETFPLESCGMGNQRWIIQRGREADEFLIHEIGHAGQTVAKLGRRESPPPDLEAVFQGTDHLFYSSLALGCDPISGAVIMMHHGQPIIRAFSADDGEDLWRAGIDGFVQGGYARGQGCCFAGIPDPSTGTYSMGWAIVPDGHGLLFASISEYTRATREHAYEVRLLDSLTGEESGSMAVPGIVMAVRHEKAYVVVREPFPQIKVFELIR